MDKNTDMNGLEMARDIRFNRKLTKADYVVPGGYEMVFGGRIISFDFMDYYGSIDDDDPTILHCEMEHPDFSAFEEFRNVSSEDLRNVSEIVECYKLSGRDVTIIKLRVLYNNSFKEIGKVLGMTEIAARKRYNRAIKVLRDIVEE